MCVYTYVRDVRALVCALIQTIITAHPIQTDREAKANMIKVQLYFRVAQICGNRIFFITIFLRSSPHRCGEHSHFIWSPVCLHAQSVIWKKFNSHSEYSMIDCKMNRLVLC